MIVNVTAMQGHEGTVFAGTRKCHMTAALVGLMGKERQGRTLVSRWRPWRTALALTRARSAPPSAGSPSALPHGAHICLIHRCMWPALLSDFMHVTAVHIGF